MLILAVGSLFRFGTQVVLTFMGCSYNDSLLVRAHMVVAPPTGAPTAAV